MAFELNYSVENKSGSTSNAYYIVIDKKISIHQDKNLILFTLKIYFDKQTFADNGDTINLPYTIGECIYNDGDLETTPLTIIIENAVLAFYKDKFNIDTEIKIEPK